MTLYQRCHELRTELRRLGDHQGRAQLEQDLRWLVELRRRRLEQLHGPTIVVLPPEPYDTEAEQRCLGAALCAGLLSGGVRAGGTGLEASDFCHALHRLTWVALLELDERDLVPDVALVSRLVLRLAHGIRNEAKLAWLEGKKVRRDLLALRLSPSLTERDVLRYLTWHRGGDLRDIEVQIGRVRDLALRRRAIELLGAVDQGMRTSNAAAATLLQRAVERLTTMAQNGGDK